MTHYLFQKKFVDKVWRYKLLNLNDDTIAWYFRRESGEFIHAVLGNSVHPDSVINPW